MVCLFYLPITYTYHLVEKHIIIPLILTHHICRLNHIFFQLDVLMYFIYRVEYIALSILVYFSSISPRLTYFLHHDFWFILCFLFFNISRYFFVVFRCLFLLHIIIVMF